jgi:2,3-bisphosphoglycerate-independent phosphoglycerate mutase
MKFIILQGDGMADYPLDVLGGKTPLEAARTPNMDWLAARGVFGLAHVIPKGFPPGSDVGNMSIMGYDPAVYHTGRSPLEAASMGVALGPKDIAFRCNLVTLTGNGSNTVMEDFTSGHISTEEARTIIGDLAGALGAEGIEFFPGVSSRHLRGGRGAK